MRYLLAIVFLLVSVSAEAQGRQIMTLPWGYIIFESNELSIVSNVDDPPKLRLAAEMGGSLGAVSWNEMRADGVMEEMILLQGKRDERYRGTLTRSGEVTLHIRDGREHVNADKAMVKILEARSDGIVFYVPVVTTAPAQ